VSGSVTLTPESWHAINRVRSQRCASFRFTAPRAGGERLIDHEHSNISFLCAAPRHRVDAGICHSHRAPPGRKSRVNPIDARKQRSNANARRHKSFDNRARDRTRKPISAIVMALGQSPADIELRHFSRLASQHTAPEARSFRPAITVRATSGQRKAFLADLL